MNQLSFPSLVAILTLFMANMTSAALIAYDQFTGYTDDDLAGQGQGFGWSGNWSSSFTDHQVSTTGGLTQTALSGVVAGGGANTGTDTTTLGNLAISRDFSSPLSSTGTYFFSFLMQGGISAHHQTINLVGANGNQARAGIWNASNEWQLIQKDNTNWSSTSTGVSTTENTTHFVLKLELGTDDIASLFINPADVAALNTPDQTRTYSNGLDWGALSNIAIYRRNQDSNVGNFNFDEIRVGTEAADMFSDIPVPEPSVISLISVLGAFLLLRRSR